MKNSRTNCGPTALPPLNPEKSIADWERWGKTKGGGVNVPPRVYEQHVPRKEPATKKVKRK